MILHPNVIVLQDMAMDVDKQTLYNKGSLPSFRKARENKYRVHFEVVNYKL